MKIKVISKSRVTKLVDVSYLFDDAAIHFGAKVL